jgi:ubiquitin-protein ligase
MATMNNTIGIGPGSGLGSGPGPSSGLEPAVVISKETFRRLIKDVKELIHQPLTSHGIYYQHNEDDFLQGKALIIGPMDTPYENGYYLFDFKFPPNYPHSPPEVKFCTHDGQTRFNPNLYVNGKVCISILNTWQGEQWTGCQTISTVLLSLCTLLHSNPLLNEPGITSRHNDILPYNTIITYKNFETAILKVLTSEYTRTHFSMFTAIIKEHFLEKFATNLARLTALNTTYPQRKKLQTTIYRMYIIIEYKELLAQFQNVKENLLA